jgi:uncharacterized protein HemX
MQNAIFEEEENLAIRQPLQIKKKKPEEEKESKSEIAKWLEKHEFVTDAKSGEYRTIVVAILIIALAVGIFTYGIGKRQAQELEDTGNVYLKTDR